MKGTVKIDYTNASGAQTSKQVTFSSNLTVDDIVFPSLRALIGVWGTSSNDTKKYGVNDILSKIGGVKGIFGGVLLGDINLNRLLPETLCGFAGADSGSEANQGSIVSQTLEGKVLTEVFKWNSLKGTLFGNTPRTDRLTVRLAHRLCTKALSRTGQGSPFINYLQADTTTGDTPRAATAKFSSEYGIDNANLPLISVERYYKEGTAQSNYGGSLHYKKVQVESPSQVGTTSLGVYANVYKESWREGQEMIGYSYDNTYNQFLFRYSSALPSQHIGQPISPEGLSGYTFPPSADDTSVLIVEFPEGAHDIVYTTPTNKFTQLNIKTETVYNSIKALMTGKYMFLGTPDTLYLLVVTSSKTTLYRLSNTSAPTVYRDYSNRVPNGDITGAFYFQSGNQQGFIVSTTLSIIFIPLGSAVGMVDMNYRDANNKGSFFYKVLDIQTQNDMNVNVSQLKSWYPAGKYTYNALANPLGTTVFNFTGLNADWSKGLTLSVSIDFS